MLRRSHKKSRGGCLECKRRHMKCDARRPICVQCTLSERKCSYASPAPSSHATSTPPSSTPSSYTASPNLSPLDPNTTNTAVVPVVTQYGTPSPPHLHAGTSFDLFSTSHNPILNHAPSLSLPAPSPLNLTHMHLMNHLTTSKTLFNLSGLQKNQAKNILGGIALGLQHPYLLHAMLAYSARHLSLMLGPSSPSSSKAYALEAISLQTRAVELFIQTFPTTTVTDTGIQIDPETCIPTLVFSSMTAHHIFADTLALRTPSLSTFLARYTHCVSLSRGTYTIAKSAWPILVKDPRLEPLITWSAQFNQRDPVGQECTGIVQLVEAAGSMTAEEKEASKLALRYVQIGIEAILYPPQSEHLDSSRYHMLFLWNMLVPQVLTDMLSTQRPEALAVLAYYALLLHYGREMWQVGDAGRYLVGMVADGIGKEWWGWVEGPWRRIMGPQEEMGEAWGVS